MRLVVGVAAAALLALGACSSSETVTGIVITVEGDLKTVSSFELRTSDGELLTIIPAPDGTFGFPLSHLHEHRVTLGPVAVELDRSVDPPLATAIFDADSSESHE